MNENPAPTKFDHDRLARLQAHYVMPGAIEMGLIQAGLETRDIGATSVVVDLDPLEPLQVALLARTIWRFQVTSRRPDFPGEPCWWEPRLVDGSRITFEPCRP